jgi:hypothetical protein
MSNKSAKKPKQLSVPRALPEIQKDYAQVCNNAGQIQYQIKVYEQELIQTNQRLLSLNQEAAARNQLDAAAKPAPAPEVTNG